MILTPLFLQALTAAEAYHHTQMRKSTDIPYFSHLLAVSSLVLESGGTEIEAIAALLHDAAEDAGGAPVLAEIARDFGPEVARIVEACSDAFPLPGEQKPQYRPRKERYIEHLAHADPSTMLVSAADKLANLRSIQADVREIGNGMFARFSAPEPKRDNVLWYYRALHDVYVSPSSPADRRRERLTVQLADILTWFGA